VRDFRQPWGKVNEQILLLPEGLASLYPIASGVRARIAGWAMARRLATVFGGSGFIGRYIVQRLARRGWLVRVAIRRPDEALFLKPMGDVGQITPVATNIRHERSVSAALEGADAAINLVGILYEHGAQRFDAVHAEGPRRLARAAKIAGVEQFLHVSALGADPASPSAYARSKAAGEIQVLDQFPTATILRPSIVFGPEDDFFNRFAKMAQIFPALPLIGGGQTRFQPVYVGDVADAAMAAIENPEAQGRIYELAGPKAYSFRELMEILLAQIGRRRLLLPIPMSVARFQASILQLLPQPPLTIDQLRQLERDNVPSGQFVGLKDLGIEPEGLEAILPSYLDRFRPGGRFARA
jgi:NADH dehydrogenase